jgi:hypothetical protein
MEIVLALIVFGVIVFGYCAIYLAQIKEDIQDGRNIDL